MDARLALYKSVLINVLCAVRGFAPEALALKLARSAALLAAAHAAVVFGTASDADLQANEVSEALQPCHTSSREQNLPA